jgi:hypothetical protein
MLGKRERSARPSAFSALPGSRRSSCRAVALAGPRWPRRGEYAEKFQAWRPTAEVEICRSSRGEGDRDCGRCGDACYWLTAAGIAGPWCAADSLGSPSHAGARSRHDLTHVAGATRMCPGARRQARQRVLTEGENFAGPEVVHVVPGCFTHDLRETSSRARMPWPGTGI